MTRTGPRPHNSNSAATSESATHKPPPAGWLALRARFSQPPRLALGMRLLRAPRGGLGARLSFAWWGTLVPWLLLAAGLVEGQALERVVVVLPDCGDLAVWQRDVVELLRVELQVERARGIEIEVGAGLAEQRRALWVQRVCAAPSGSPLHLLTSDPQRGAVLERTLSLRDVPAELQSRVVALALAELLRASWPDVDTGRSAVVHAQPRDSASARGSAEVAAAEVGREASAADSRGSTDLAAAEAGREASAADSRGSTRLETAAEGTRVAATEPRAVDSVEATQLDARRDHAEASARSAELRMDPRLWLVLGPALHVSLTGAPVLYGAEVSLSWWRLSVGALGYLSSAGDALGDIAVKRVHGFAAFDVLQVERGPWLWSAAVRGGLGGTFASAHAAGTALSTGASDLSADGALEAGLALRFAAQWAVRLRANIGFAYAPAYRADERVVADYSGLFTGVSLTLAHAATRVRL